MNEWVKRLFRRNGDRNDRLSFEQCKLAGDQSFYQGHFEAAVRYYRQASVLNSQDPKVLCNLGYALKALNLLPEAQDAAARASMLGPCSPDLYMLFAELAEMQEDVAESERQLRLAIAGQPDFEPAYLACHHLLVQQGRIADARTLLMQGVGHLPKCAEFHFLLGNFDAAEGQFGAAVLRYQAVLAIKPTYSEALLNLGAAFAQLGRHAAAESAWKEILELSDTYKVEAYLMLGIAAHQQGNEEVAIANYRDVLRIDPGHEVAAINLADLLYTRGEMGEAVASYAAVLSVVPSHALANFRLGIIYHERQQYDLAIAHYKVALQTAPSDAEIQINLGNSLSAQGKTTEAIAVYQAVLTANPDHVIALYNLAGVLSVRKDYQSAELIYRRALSIDPHHVESMINLASMLHFQCRYDEAEIYLRKILQFEPLNAIAKVNLGSVLNARQEFIEALVCFNDVLQDNPQSADARMGRAITSLLLGDFVTGWSDYEFRAWQTGAKVRTVFPRPAMTSDTDIAGKTILLYADQGIGDALQFVRYVQLVQALGAKLILEVHAPLVPLLAGLVQASCIYATGEALPPYDFRCELASLPLIFKTELNTVPSNVPYIQPAPERVAYWRKEFASPVPNRVPRIGVVWSGNPSFKDDVKRSIALKDMAPLWGKAQMHFYLLQPEIRASDAPYLPVSTNVFPLGERLTDFAETAAVIANLDLVISVDTSVAHLAGAMGREVWILLPFTPDFRWLLNRSDSPWYPTARLFRQSAIGDWPEVVTRVERALGEKFA